jgi:hypothetical protein
MTAIVIEEARPGILFVAYPKEHTLAEWEAHTADIIAALKRGKRFALISDTIGSAPPDASERRLIADSFEQYEDLWKKHCVGGAAIVSSQLIRGAMTALQWLRPPPFPTANFATRDEAFAWAEQRLSHLAG